ncbi:MAG: xanthine dehydrogenase family protein subunit M, partial [Spirochaetota bacterium]|nr:xanthine dehydrogenase family protein subunit M [Spirochaetota bacterium]
CMTNFDYLKPVSLKEACTLRAEHAGASQLLLGGTDLIVEMDQGSLSPEFLIDLRGIGDLWGIREAKNEIVIGAAVTFTELIKSKTISKECQALTEASKLVASVGVRNVATLAGNICHAVPSAEGAAPLLIRDAELTAVSTSGERRLSIHDFFTGPRKTALAAEEIVTAIHIPRNSLRSGENYLKLGRYRGEDLAQVGVAVSVDEKYQYKIAYAAVGPVPLRITKAEEILQGAPPSEKELAAAVKAVKQTVNPITDIRASKEYRLYMCGVMLEKAVKTAVQRMNGNTTGGQS